MEFCTYFFQLHLWKNCLGCLGPSISRVPVALQNVVSHYQGVTSGLAAFVDGTTNNNVLFRTLSSNHFLHSLSRNNVSQLLSP